MDKGHILQKILDGRRKHLSKIQGSLIGGAVGDALGYTVEFMSYRDIRQSYGKNGITEYELIGEKALISDETQMTLFTANGLLYGETRMMMRGIGNAPHSYLPYAYLDWLYTQDKNYKPNFFVSWLVGISELNQRRTPGTTCLTALSSGKLGSIENPLNNSSGCGGVMRSAPVGLFYGQYYDGLSDENVVRYSAESAAITHGHPLGYIPAGFLALIVKKAAFENDSLPVIVEQSLNTTKNVFGENEFWKSFESIIREAIDLSSNNENDEDNIYSLGKGWIGHEALAIAIYAALRYQHDFSSAMIAAVNHSGDSDSTGSICGNILGAKLGLDGIASNWMNNLELCDTILEVGMDLCDHCHMENYGDYEDSVWQRKYVNINGLNEPDEPDAL